MNHTVFCLTLPTVVTTPGGTFPSRFSTWTHRLGLIPNTSTIVLPRHSVYVPGGGGRPWTRVRMTWGGWEDSDLPPRTGVVHQSCASIWPGGKLRVLVIINVLLLFVACRRIPKGPKHRRWITTLDLIRYRSWERNQCHLKSRVSSSVTPHRPPHLHVARIV